MFGCDPKCLIVKGRGTDQLHELVGDDFAAVLCSDNFSAYVKNARLNPEVKAQFCWAHLIRDLRFVEQSGGRSSRGWAIKVMKDVRRCLRPGITAGSVDAAWRWMRS